MLTRMSRPGTVLRARSKILGIPSSCRPSHDRGSLKAYNALRIAQRSPTQALRGGILGLIGGWAERLLTQQNLFHLASDRVRPLNL